MKLHYDQDSICKCFYLMAVCFSNCQAGSPLTNQNHALTSIGPYQCIADHDAALDLVAHWYDHLLRIKIALTSIPMHCKSFSCSTRSCCPLLRSTNQSGLSNLDEMSEIPYPYPSFMFQLYTKTSGLVKVCASQLRSCNYTSEQTVSKAMRLISDTQLFSRMSAWQPIYQKTICIEKLKFHS